MNRTVRALVLVLASLAAPFASAQTEPAASRDPIAERSTSFQAVEGSEAEEVSGLGLMVSAYALILGLVGAYVVRLGRLERSLAADVANLEARLPKDPSDPS